MSLPPNLSRARLAGISARQVGKPKEANPYTGKASLIHEHREWLNGWNERNARGK